MNFIRNEIFNARNYFDQTKRAPLYRRQDFGTTFGGPLYIPGHYNLAHNKTFFFFSEEVRLEKTPTDYNQGVPSVAERQGNFSDVCPAISPGGSNYFTQAKYPDCPAVNGSTYPVTYTNVNVPYPSLIDVTPQADALLSTNVIPLPTSTTGCNSTISSCYNASVSPSTFWREELFRVDHDLTSGEHLSFRYIHDTWHTTTLTPQWGLVQNSFPTVQNYLQGPGISLVADLAQVLKHGFLNRIGIGYTAAHISLTTVAGSGVDLKRSNIPSLDGPCHTITYQGIIPVPPGQYQQCPLGQFFDNTKDLIPGLAFGGTNQAYGGHGFFADTGYAPWKDANPTYSLRDDVNKTLGKHTLSFGGQVTIAQQNELSGVNGANTGDTQGLLTYSNEQSAKTTNNAFADFLGNVIGGGNNGISATQEQSYQQDSAQGHYYNRYKAVEFYLQDDFRVTTRFTLNLGFRASLFGSWYNSKGTAYNWEPQAFNPSIATGVFIGNDNGGGLYNSATNSPIPLDLNHLDPSLTNGLVHCGVSGVPKSCQSSHLFNPAPRVGFAWDPFGNGKMSVRAGYGLFWEHGTSYEANTGSLIGGAPLIISESVPNQASGQTLGFNCIGGGVRDGMVLPPGSTCFNQLSALNAAGTLSPAAFPISVASIPTKANYSYVQQWSLSVQREVGQHLVGNVAYVGSKGTHLTAESNLNQIHPLDLAQNPFALHQPIDSNLTCSGYNPRIPNSDGQDVYVSVNQPAFVNLSVACSGTAAENGLGVLPGRYRPYRGFNQILAVRNVADSQYHALQATLHRTKKPLDVGVAYTYSHSLDDSSDRSNANFVNTYDLSRNKASSDFDERHLLNISYIYDLPLMELFHTVFQAGLSDPTNSLNDLPLKTPSHLVKTVLAGWQLTGITAYQTGTPFSVVNGGGSNGIGLQDNAGVAVGLNAGSYADVIGNPHGPKPPGGRNSQSFGPLLMNPGAFAAPRGLTYGNAGRNSLSNPSRTNFNTALLKHFPVFGERDLEFRAEAFNVFNHTQFRIYDPTHPGNTGNNVISCYAGEGTDYSAAGGGGSDCLTGNSFLHPVDAHDPRILQFGLKLTY